MLLALGLLGGLELIKELAFRVSGLMVFWVYGLRENNSDNPGQARVFRSDG